MYYGGHHSCGSGHKVTVAIECLCQEEETYPSVGAVVISLSSL